MPKHLQLIYKVQPTKQETKRIYEYSNVYYNRKRVKCKEKENRRKIKGIAQQNDQRKSKNYYITMTHKSLSDYSYILIYYSHCSV